MAHGHKDDGYIQWPGTREDFLTRFQPIHEWVVVERDEEERVQGRIILPKKGRQNRVTTGTARLVGPGETIGVSSETRVKCLSRLVCLPSTRIQKPLVKPGDRIVFNVYAGHDIRTTDGAEFIVMIDGEVLAKFVQEKEGEAKKVHAEVKRREPLQTRQKYHGKKG